MANPLTEDQVRDALGGLPDWSHENDRLTKTYKFGSFREAMSFLVRIAFEAEERNHHPELFNVYNTVKIGLNTHDAGGKVTQKDVDLAKVIEQVNWLPRKG